MDFIDIYKEAIIEVNNLQNNDLIGKIVLSKAGRDKDHLYVVVGNIDEDYVLLVNGDNKTIIKPKKKKAKHISVIDDVNDEVKAAIINNDKSTDIQIKRFLKLKGIVKEG